MRRFVKHLTHWLAAGAVAAAFNVQALTVTGDQNHSLTFERSPQRVVSMLPSLTESVCALGQCHRLIGVDRYSNFPVSVKKLPQLGGGLDPNLEAIVALRPDVVLMAGSSKGHARLSELGIKVLLLEPKNSADVLRSLQVLGDMFEVPPERGALRLWAQIQSGVQAAATSVARPSRGQTVYFDAGAPYAAGSVSFVGELLSAVGAVNIVPASMGAFPALNPEFIVASNPSVIMLSQSNRAQLLARPGWGNVRAIREKRLCAFSPQEQDILMRPGPRMVQAAQLMVACLNRQPN
jgi:iron complex transport system substrate-binding protein